MKRLLLLAPLVLAACGGHDTETLTYGGHELEPKSILFARVPISAGEFTVALISDRGDACTQFDGLACLPQPQLGTTLEFRTPVFDKGTRSVGSELSAHWLDFQGVRVLEGTATSGQLEVDQSEDEKEFGGTFTLALPQGELKGEFTADFCKPMRDYYLGCSVAQ
ncbi:hypothetical protein [Hyalangium versicolor]|uniref:hypothetical protein n=1 Tax=Hyalangium versicolor TaxID=2861190 RepID=UPI001CCBE0DD|nr:hypothetical protein [Hyalangium versicolor]